MSSRKLKISDLVPDDENFNTGNEFGEALIEKSFSQFGAGRSILVDKNNRVIAGNKSLQKFAEAGGENVILIESTGTDIVAVKRTDIDLDTKHGREMALADNATAKANITWDTQNLLNWEMPTEEWGVELSYELIDEDSKEGSDDAPAVDETVPAVSELGKIYQLGRHRLMCGDALDMASLSQLRGGLIPDMLFTDPPFGINYSGRGKNTKNKILNDDIDPTEFYNVCPEITERYIWGRVENYPHLNEKPRDTIIWKKNNFGMGRGYRGQYECCFYFGDFNGSDSDVWEVAKDINYVHPTQKPVDLCMRAIRNSLPEIVLDLFGGSGSTLIACEQTNRTCLMMELSPHYCDVIRKRYHIFITGEEEGWEEGTPEIIEVRNTEI